MLGHRVPIYLRMIAIVRDKKGDRRMINRRAIRAVFRFLGRNRLATRKNSDRFRGSQKIDPLVEFMGIRAYGNSVLQIGAIIQEPIARPIREAFRMSDIM